MGNLYNVLKSLCDERNITGYKMCKDCGIQPSIMTDLKMGRRSSVKAETAARIATYFNVTVDYLLGNDTKKEPIQMDEPTYDDFTYALYNESKELTEDNKNKLIEMAKFFKQQQEKEK